MGKAGWSPSVTAPRAEGPKKHMEWYQQENGRREWVMRPRLLKKIRIWAAVSGSCVWLGGRGRRGLVAHCDWFRFRFRSFPAARLLHDR
jgi:hypothetical protein